MTAWPELPEDVVQYKQTRDFDQDTLPAALQEDHRTREGTWGRVEVLEGQVELELQGVGRRRLTRAVPGVLPPMTPHRLVLCGPVRLRIAFLHQRERA